MNVSGLTRFAYGRLTIALTVIFGGTWYVTEAYAEVASVNGPTSKGKTVYDRYCAGCHGAEGKGDGYKLLGADPANLASPATKQKSDAVLLKTIHEGKPGMPSWKLRLSEEDSRDVLAYIRTLARQSGQGRSQAPTRPLN